MNEQFAPTRHDLKILPVHFDAVEDGVKTFELRLNDRDYKVGDILWLKEWDDDKKLFTGRVLQRRVSHVLHGAQLGLMAGWAILSIKPIHSYGELEDGLEIGPTELPR